MDDENDAPPLLVAAEGTSSEEVALSANMEDVQIARVPITIITGS